MADHGPLFVPGLSSRNGHDPEWRTLEAARDDESGHWVTLDDGRRVFIAGPALDGNGESGGGWRAVGNIKVHAGRGWEKTIGRALGAKKFTFLWDPHTDTLYYSPGTLIEHAEMVHQAGLKPADQDRLLQGRSYAIGRVEFHGFETLSDEKKYLAQFARKVEPYVSKRVRAGVYVPGITAPPEKGMAFPDLADLVQETREGWSKSQVEVSPDDVPLTRVVAIGKLKTSQRREDAVPEKLASVLATFRGRKPFQPLRVSALDGGDYHVLDGHHRLWAAEELGFTHLPVTVSTPMAEAGACVRCGRPLREGHWVTLPDVGPVCLPGGEGCDDKSGKQAPRGRTSRYKDVPQHPELKDDPRTIALHRELAERYGNEDAGFISDFYSAWTSGGVDREGFLDARRQVRRWLEGRKDEATKTIGQLYEWTQEKIRNWPERVWVYRTVFVNGAEADRIRQAIEKGRTITLPLAKGRSGGVSFSGSERGISAVLDPKVVGPRPLTAVPVVFKIAVSKKAILATQRYAPGLNEFPKQDEVIVLSPARYIKVPGRNVSLRTRPKVPAPLPDMWSLVFR